jgi:cytochrome b561
MSALIRTRYSTISILLHWLIALLVLLMLSVGFFMADLPDTQKPMVYMVHKSLGISLIFLMLLRIGWILYAGKPALPESTPLWELALARLVQYGFYLLLIVMPVVGWIMSTAAGKPPVFWGLMEMPFPGVTKNPHLAEYMWGWHATIAWILIGMIALHVLGAMKHLIIDKNGVFSSMLPARCKAKKFP